MVVDSPVRNSLTPATAILFTLEDGGGLQLEIPSPLQQQNSSRYKLRWTLQLEIPSPLQKAKNFTLDNCGGPSS
jgi:hypothetical protein